MAQEPTGIDAYNPAQIAVRIEQAGVAKTRLKTRQLLALSFLAGAFIAFGGAFFTLVMTGADPLNGADRLLGGAAFSLGLILVIVGGAELFTGNALIVMAWVDRLVSTQALARNWLIVYVGNLIGAAVIALTMAASGTLTGGVGQTAAAIAEAKLSLDILPLFARAVLCNALVCLAVWLTFAARSVAGKILAIIWPITAFVALGFEHSVANMYLLPAGAIAGADVPLSAAALNLLVVTAGNIVGGAGGVALSYWAAYGNHAGRER